MKIEILNYLQKQLRNTDSRIKKYTEDLSGKKHPQRFLFVKLKTQVDSFLSKTNTRKMVIMPGLRGVGKTTLMAQVYRYVSAKKLKLNCLFLSVDDAVNLFNTNINELISAYEEILGCDLESVKEPTFIFLDEIQSDGKWAKSLKSFEDKTSNVFFLCTGSSALSLQSTTDLARRADFERVAPACFIEYQMLKNNIFPINSLRDKIRQLIYYSQDISSAYKGLVDLRSSVNIYWAKANKRDIKDYLLFGSLPFTLTISNEVAIFDSISLQLDKIINQDMPSLGKFDHQTLGMVKRLLFVLAENDTSSLNKLEKEFKIHRNTISNIFDVLEKAELLIKVPAYGSNMTAVKQPAKYLFMSPAIRTSFFYHTGLEDTFLTRQGKLLEDSIGAHFYQEFILRGNGAMRYDSAKGGADFILQILNKKQIIIEVGIGRKDKRQIFNSMKKIKSDYNIIFSMSELRIDKENKIIFIPLDYYFLM